MFEGYKTVAFFVLALLVAVANYFGFGDFKMSPDQLELFNGIIILAGLALRWVTKSKVFGGK